MILKEDYFNDLDLTDDDIKSSDSIVASHNNEYANEKEYYNDMLSKYSHYITLCIDADHIITDSVLWTDKIPHVLKKLFYLFDSYGMEYSTPVVLQSDYFVKKYIKNKFKGCKFFDFYGYKLITHYDIIKDIEENRDVLSVILFFNPPKTQSQSYTTVCKFIGNIMRTLWKNKNYDTFVDSFCIYNFMSIATSMYIDNPYTTDIVKPTSKLIDIIKLFFPKKKRDDIKKELIEDKQLLLKLYKCFPDY